MRLMINGDARTFEGIADVAGLVRALGLPFRRAHEVTGRIVALAEERGLPLHKLALADMQGVEPQITDEVYSVLASFPENYLDFAHSPEGVTALGDAVAQTFYADACQIPPLMLTVH